jgi:hypothetical protein
MSNTEQEKEKETEHDDDDGGDDQGFPLGTETGDVGDIEQTGVTTEADTSQ